MHHLARLTLTVVILLLNLNTGSLWSQSVANYAVARSTGNTYNSIVSSGSSIPAWRYTGAYSQDDNRSYFVPVGFDFWYDGTRYTELSISTNGFVDFSSSTDDGGPQADDFGYSNAAFTASASGNATRPALAVFYDDLTAQGGTQALGNSIKYELTGTSPNRIFTLEWINMATYLNTTPSLNFQVKIYEKTGIIDFNYGTMTQGTHTFSYTLGINAPTMNATPTAAQLKTQQTANSAVFSNTVQNNLSIMPSAGSRIRFTPPVPANPTGSLTFSAVTQSAMTLNWTNWASNEVGYVIYNSTDAVNYYFVTQTAVNATSANITGLNPSQTYNWRVYAVTEGALSNALTGMQSTLPAGNKVSNNANGNWNNANHWLPVGVPTATDNVTILNGHTMTINQGTADCYYMTVGQGASGTLRFGNNNTARTLNVGGQLVVKAGATLTVNTASNTTHTLNVYQDITNFGSIDLSPDNNSHCDAMFLKNGSQKIQGSGTTNNYYGITVDEGSSYTNILEVTATNFTAPNGFLTLINGTFKLSTSNSFTNTMSTGNYSMGSTQGIWLNNPNATFNYNGTVTLDGLVRVSAGTLNIGNAANENLVSNGGELNISGGTMNIAGFYNSTGLNNLALFDMSGGTLNVATTGTTNTTTAPFNITSPGSEVEISGGTIVIHREGGSGAQDWGYRVINTSNSSVTGGTLQIGDASTPANQVMEIETDLPVGNLLINSSNATGKLNSLDLTVANNVNITLGTLNLNNLLLAFAGDWTDNANFIPGTGTVMFNGSGTHFLTDPTGETFYNLLVDGTGTLTLNNTITTSGDLTIVSSLDVGAGNNLVTLKNKWNNFGNFICRQGLVQCTGTVSQTLSGTSTSTFYNFTLNNATGAVAQSGNFEVKNALTPQAGVLTVNPLASFTLLSDATSTARIAQKGATGGFSGNYTVQRYISGRAAGYSDMGAPVTATTFADWNNELLLSYAYNPPYAYPSCYGYSETLYDFVPVTSTSQTISPGQGFEVWLDSYWNYTTFDPTTVTSVGTPYAGTLNMNSSITNVNDGWNLVANPYASYISLDALIASATQISGTVLYYDEAISDYNTLATGSGVELAPHQGFWVQVTGGSPNFSFQETHKTTTTNSNFRSVNVNEDFFIRLSKPSSPVKLNSHTYLRFDGQANAGMDESDVTFRGLPHPEAPHVYTINGAGVRNYLRVNALPQGNAALEIPVGYKVNNDGIYRFDIENPENLRAAGFNCAKLVDTETKSEYDIFENDRLELFLQAGQYNNRFILVLHRDGNCTAQPYNDLHVMLGQLSTHSGKLIVQDPETHLARFAVFNMLGEQVYPWQNINAAGEYVFDLQVEAGMYLVKYQDGNREKTFRFIVAE